MNETQLTTNKTPQDPRVIEWQGQQYLDSYDCHQDYLKDGDPKKAKFKNHRDYRRKIRDIESYSIYVDHKNIVTFSWEQVKTGPAQELRRLTPLFRRIGHANLILLDATAQLALTHHLDNELSKQMSVTVNTAAARELTGQGRLPAELAKRTLRAYLDIAKMLGCPEHVAQQYAVKRIFIETGTDLQSLLNAAESTQPLAKTDRMLEPNDLAEELGFGHGNTAGNRINIFLEQIGWQHKINGKWVMTSAGQPYGIDNPWINHGKTGYNIKWRVEAVRNELRRRNMLPPQAA